MFGFFPPRLDMGRRMDRAAACLLRSQSFFMVTPRIQPRQPGSGANVPANVLLEDHEQALQNTAQPTVPFQLWNWTFRSFFSSQQLGAYEENWIYYWRNKDTTFFSFEFRNCGARFPATWRVSNGGVKVVSFGFSALVHTGLGGQPNHCGPKKVWSQSTVHSAAKRCLWMLPE